MNFHPPKSIGELPYQFFWSAVDRLTIFVQLFVEDLDQPVLIGENPVAFDD